MDRTDDEYNEYQEFLKFKQMKQAADSVNSTNNTRENKSSNSPKGIIGGLVVIVILMTIYLISHPTKSSVRGSSSNASSVRNETGIAVTAVPSVNSTDKTIVYSTARPTNPPAVAPSNVNDIAFRDSCLDFNYKSIARNPDQYVGQRFKVTGQVFDVTVGGLFDSYKKYYKVWLWNDSLQMYLGDMIYVFDERDENSAGYVKVLEDDIITIYGTFEGMVSTKNYLNNSKSEDVALHMYCVDLISG